MSENIECENNEDGKELLTKCGDIYIGQNFDILLLFCTLCEEKCSSVEYFLAHLKAMHLGLSQYDDYLDPFVEIKDEKLIKDEEIDNCSTYLDEDDDIEEELDFYVTEPIKNEYDTFITTSERLEDEEDLCSENDNQLNEIEEIERYEEENMIYEYSHTDNDKLLDKELEIIAKDNSSEGETDKDNLKSKILCKFCNQNFDYEHDLQQHDCGFTKKKLHQCDICKKIFNRKSNLNIHKVLHDNFKAYNCDMCNASFAHKQNLVVHRRRHTSEKPFKCDYCEKSFVTSTEKISHTRFHTGERKFVCEICGKGHSSSSHLTQHRRRHFNIRNYHCSYCDKKFANSYTLKLHQITHEDAPRSHKCENCDAAFKTKKSLLQHIRIHSEIKQYKCKICFKSFAQQPGLYSHMKMHAISK